MTHNVSHQAVYYFAFPFSRGINTNKRQQRIGYKAWREESYVNCVYCVHCIKKKVVGNVKMHFHSVSLTEHLSIFWQKYLGKEVWMLALWTDRVHLHESFLARFLRQFPKLYFLLTKKPKTKKTLNINAIVCGTCNEQMYVLDRKTDDCVEQKVRRNCQ